MPNLQRMKILQASGRDDLGFRAIPRASIEQRCKCNDANAKTAAKPESASVSAAEKTSKQVCAHCAVCNTITD